MNLCRISIALLLLATTAYAQGNESQPKHSSTELEALMQTKGHIVMKEFHPVGAVAGQHGTRLSIEALILSDPSDPNIKKRGLRIEVTGSGRLEKEHTSLLDLEEVEALSKGIAYMSSLAKEWQGQSRENTEVLLSTKADFQVGFYHDKGEAMAFTKSGRIGGANAILTMDSLSQLKSVADRGLEYLKTK